ncbi:Quinolinate phosphoribosyltransferase [decarboxylating] [hydrothermal vent metagenome]|uniref:Probable nicotinate-nucleotide pyrophosphorylase [carboxylating] n=1 Tax=hydrothermal vent metagenome TaxID=652676 RepID=A0A3B1BH37_9ZZZZ
MLPAALVIQEQIKAALAEDVGSGDQTAALIPAAAVTSAQVVSREKAVLAGVAWFDEVFRQLNHEIQISWNAQDGDTILPDQVLCLLSGNARAVLTGERTALNYLQTLSGTATRSRQYADMVAGTGVRILDTRKTLPGLRLQQKYAVTCGGCFNHRIGLYDAILIKENHIMAAGSILAAVEQAQANAPGLEIEVEVEDLEELEQALSAGVQRVLLDNFALDLLREAVQIGKGRARLEASGGVNLTTIRAIAETGIDDISVGALTKDVEAVDFSMRFSEVIAPNQPEQCAPEPSFVDTEFFPP